ncbi:hypothetical protein JXL19_00325 [bacterium]|nr:hypothetical protein [bacterium]
MNICSFRTCGLALILLLSAASAGGDENSKAKPSWEDFRIISARNIFSRNRQPDIKPVFSESRQMTVVEQKEESFLILRGIARKTDQYVAFVEDSRSSEMKQVYRGDKIGNGEITAISIDFLTYELEGNAIKVKTGMAFEGKAAGTIPGSFQGFGSSQKNFMNFSPGAQVESQAAPQDESSNAILQRLKERRKKELGQ